MLTNKKLATVNNPPELNSAAQDTIQRQRPQRIDIGDGLVMRWSTQADAENVAGCLAEAYKVYTHLLFWSLSN